MVSWLLFSLQGKNTQYPHFQREKFILSHISVQGWLAPKKKQLKSGQPESREPGMGEGRGAGGVLLWTLCVEHLLDFFLFSEHFTFWLYCSSTPLPKVSSTRIGHLSLHTAQVTWGRSSTNICRINEQAEEMDPFPPAQLIFNYTNENGERDYKPRNKGHPPPRS